MLKCNLFFVLILSLNSTLNYAQDKNLYSWLDDKVGLENTALHNGTEFINPYLLEDNAHRFFKSDTFTIGSITYNDQKFYNIPLKYDLYQDEVIVMLSSKNGGENQLLLHTEKIKNFELHNSYFELVNKNNDNSKARSGFYELLSYGKHFKLYKKSKKKIKKLIKNKTVRYKFIEEKPIYYLQTGGEFFSVEKKKYLVSKYPALKEELSAFNWNTRDKKKNEEQLILAVNKLNQLIDSKTI